MLLAVKSKKYSIGIIKYQDVENENGESSREYVAVCNCETVKRLGKLTYRELNNLHIVCEDCGNSNFIWPRREDYHFNKAKRRWWE